MVKILLAEDDEALRDGIICNLQMQFDNIGKEYKITGVPNGLAALEKLRNEKYDILITDNIMPEMNGLDLIVKAFDNKIAPKVIILMSGVVDGFDDYVKKYNVAYLRKPFLPDRLFDILQSYNKYI